MTQCKALLLINPRSRNGSETRIEEGIAQLGRAGITVLEIILDNTTTASQVIEQHYHQIQLVIIGGGDGTIHSALPALYRYKIPFAVLPLGTANDFARSLGIPTDIDAALQLIEHGKYRKINLGVVNGHYFLNVAHIGLGVQVTRELTPDLKKKWGVFSYVGAAFAAFKAHKKFQLVIKTAQREYRMKSIQLAIGNGRYYGGGNVIDEESEIDDGLLRLYSLYPLSFWQLLTCSPLLRLGKHKNNPASFTLSGRNLEIITTPGLEIHADGEYISNTPAAFAVIPQALEVICADEDQEQNE